MHPWHDLPPGENPPALLRVVVEVPRGDTTKYELDREYGVLAVNRILTPPVPYPAHYGFVPRTLDEDGDPLDALVVMQNAVVPLAVLRARPIGVVKLEDRGQIDDKLICVHVDDPSCEAFHTFGDLPGHDQERFKWFFEVYQDQLQRDVRVAHIGGRQEAEASVRRGLERYAAAFPDRPAPRPR